MQVREERIHVWYLEITDRDAVRSETATRQYELKQVTTPLPELNRFLYATVGASCCWYMRLGWTYQQWQDVVEKPTLQTWIAYDGATPVGYFELEKHHNNEVEICYFGLVPSFIGYGHGKNLLEDAIDRAWAFGGTRVWLHTCTLDHPQALPNYLSRGFRVYREEDFIDHIPAEPLEPWAGATINR